MGMRRKSDAGTTARRPNDSWASNTRCSVVNALKSADQCRNRWLKCDNASNVAFIFFAACPAMRAVECPRCIAYKKHSSNERATCFISEGSLLSPFHQMIRTCLNILWLSVASWTTTCQNEIMQLPHYTNTSRLGSARVTYIAVLCYVIHPGGIGSITENCYLTSASLGSSHL